MFLHCGMPFYQINSVVNVGSFFHEARSTLGKSNNRTTEQKKKRKTRKKKKE